MVLRTWYSTGNVLRPEAEQTGVLFWTYQTFCWTDVCDKHQELEEASYENIQNSKQQWGYAGPGPVFIWSLRPFFSLFATIIKELLVAWSVSLYVFP